MKIVFTNHAKIRLAERKIKMTQIKETLKNPDSKKETFQSAIQLRKKFNDGTLEIIAKYTLSKIIIITFYYL